MANLTRLGDLGGVREFLLLYGLEDEEEEGDLRGLRKPKVTVGHLYHSLLRLEIGTITGGVKQTKYVFLSKKGASKGNRSLKQLLHAILEDVRG